MGKIPRSHYPLMGDRPMRYPYTMAAKLAQFPFVYHWRYDSIFKFYLASAFVVVPIIMKWIGDKTWAPSNFEYWHNERKKWYTKVPRPDEDLY